MGSQICRDFGGKKILARIRVKKKVVTERTVALLIHYLLVTLHSVLKLQLKGFT